MTLVQAVVFGVVQGLAQFLPISSAAHLRVLPPLLDWPAPAGAYAAVIQLGAAAAGLVWVGKDLAWPGGRQLLGSAKPKLAVWLLVGTVPVAVLGALFKKSVEANFRSPWAMAGALILLAGVLFIGDRAATQRRALGDVGPKDAVWVGLWQALALVPGWARSGSTITGSLVRGFTREDAARFSILLSIPATLLAGLSQLKNLMQSSERPSLVLIVVGAGVSFASGLGAIAFLLTLARTGTMFGFVVYGAAMGLLLIGLVWKGAIQP